MPYSSERKRRAYYKNLEKVHKSECNRKYYVCNSEKLKARNRSAYKADPSKKKAAAAALRKLQPEKKLSQIRPIIVPTRPRLKPIVLPTRQRGMHLIDLLIEQIKKKEKLQQ